MKRVLLTTIHPAPYITLWLEGLSSIVHVDSMFAHKASSEKGWKINVSENILLYSDLSFFEKIKLLGSYDLVIFCGWGLRENVLLSFGLLMYKTKVAFFLDHPIIGLTKVNFFAKALKKLIIKTADYIFPASKSCKDYLHLTYNVPLDKLLIFPYAHSSSNINLLNSINLERKNKLKLNQKIRVFTANRFEERKGYSVVLQAFSLLKEKGMLDEFEIIIAGNGSEYKNYLGEFSSLSNNIKLLGWVENHEYQFYIDNCDVYFHSSLFEPFGIPPIDAMQRGKSVIVSNGVKSCDVFDNQKDIGVYTYPANNPLILSNIFCDIYENKFHLYDHSQKIINLVERNYSININIETVKHALYSD